REAIKGGEQSIHLALGGKKILIDFRDLLTREPLNLCNHLVWFHASNLLQRENAQRANTNVAGS
ncbi:MAG: hypothetical protein ABIQ35_08330, partial [Verrucomicrobiota bacterium]